MRKETECQNPQVLSIENEIDLFHQQYNIATKQKSRQEAITQFKAQPWWVSITPYQFGQCITDLYETHIAELLKHVLQAQPMFLKNSTEWVQTCAAVSAKTIPTFCRCLAAIINRPSFLDNARAFSAIFAPHLFLPHKKIEGLNPEQSDALFESLKFIIRSPHFFLNLRDFIHLFLQSPGINIKTFLCDSIEAQIPILIREERDVGYIALTLTSSVIAEHPLFKNIRDKIFRAFVRTHRVPDTVYATLFLIKDNYPGQQSDKLNNIINTLLSTSFSLPSIKNEIAEKIKALISEENITSTRLNKAFTQLITDIEHHQAIDIEFIIAVSQKKFACHIIQEWRHLEETIQQDQSRVDKLMML